MDHYTYQITWYAENQEYLGRCVEFPSLSWLDTTQSKALKGITELVKEVVADLKANNESVPEPLADRKYSGEFKVRIPPMLHRRLTIEAAEQGVSMNRYISAKLAAS